MRWGVGEIFTEGVRAELRLTEQIRTLIIVLFIECLLFMTAHLHRGKILILAQVCLAAV